jgi:hypothetical protein
MANIGLLEFVQSALTVSYRASAEPQVLEIRLSTAALPAMPFGPGEMLAMTRLVQWGAAGGADFSPTKGAAKVVSGSVPTVDKQPLVATDYEWEVEVAGVCPLFIRTIVEHLAISGSPHLVKSMSIHGRLPPDGSPLSVTEQDVRKWIEDPAAYPGEWKAPFEIEDKRIGKGAALRVKLAGAVDANVFTQFGGLVGYWTVAVQKFFDHTATKHGGLTAVPTKKQGPNECSANWKFFDIVQEPARRTLNNMLVRFHETVAPIAEVTLSLP